MVNEVLTPEHLVGAYAQGIFPMHDSHEHTVYWYDPDPRTIIPLHTFYVPRRLARTVRQGRFEYRFNSCFAKVIRACAEPRPGREETWLSEELITLYIQLHQRGFAHSVETFVDGVLVGGVYGVHIRGLFAGESMFSRARDASKVALVILMRHLQRQRFTLFDVQFTTPHLKQFGCMEISRLAYKQRLAQALRCPAKFGALH